ncbi:MAG: carboxypeptidase-like regulatory domain-containing protein [Candidatus Sumerlaeia bacterium]|nr:carboxypeptidase-like regulatory domain-containing protein [Candidatus Sumerlaeia bacterium]
MNSGNLLNRFVVGLWAFPLFLGMGAEPALLWAQQPINQGLEDTALPAEEERFVIRGTAMGPSGPAENVRVFLELRLSGDRLPSVFQEARTDVQGEFTFDLSAVSGTDYAVEFYTDSYRFQMARHFKRLNRFELPYQFQLSLSPGVVLRGVVVDEEGNPVDGVTISGKELVPKKTNRKGEFEVTGVAPGYHEVQFRKEGYADLLEIVEEENPGVVEGMRLVMPSAEKFVGRVVDWMGNPVAEARVVYQKPEAFKEAKTNRDGEFEIKSIPKGDEVVLKVFSGSAPEWESPLSEVESSSEEEKALIRLDAPAYVRGKVLLNENTPAASSMVNAFDLESGNFLRTAFADSEGMFLLGPFRTNQIVRLQVEGPTLRQEFAIADVDVQHDAASGSISASIDRFESEFDTKFQGTLKGTKLEWSRMDTGVGGLPGEVKYSGTLDPSGKMIQGTVEIPLLEVTGTFELQARGIADDSLSGTWVLRERYEKPKSCFTREVLEVALPKLPGELAQRIIIGKGSSISGQALNAEGKPIQSGRVALVEWDKDPNFAMVEEIRLDGKFEFTCVPEGDFRITAMDEETGEETERFYVKSGSKDVLLLTGSDESSRVTFTPKQAE